MGGIGYFGLAVSLQNENPWLIPTVFMCFSFVGNWFVNIAVFGYIPDCLRNQSICLHNLAGLYFFGELESISVDTDPVFSCEFFHCQIFSIMGQLNSSSWG